MKRKKLPKKAHVRASKYYGNWEEKPIQFSDHESMQENSLSIPVHF